MSASLLQYSKLHSVENYVKSVKNLQPALRRLGTLILLHPHVICVKRVSYSFTMMRKEISLITSLWCTLIVQWKTRRCARRGLQWLLARNHELISSSLITFRQCPWDPWSWYMISFYSLFFTVIGILIRIPIFIPTLIPMVFILQFIPDARSFTLILITLSSLFHFLIPFLCIIVQLIKFVSLLLLFFLWFSIFLLHLSFLLFFFPSFFSSSF